MTTGANKPEPAGLTAAQKKRYFRYWIIAGLSLPIIFEFLSGGVVIFVFSIVLAPAEISVKELLELYLNNVLFFAILSLTSAGFFLWTCWDHNSPDFPKRSLWLWFYLCALSPWEIYINFDLQYPRFTLGDEEYHGSILLTRSGGLLEGSVLIALGLWMALRRFRFSIGEIIWFHWLLILVFFSSLIYLSWSFDFLESLEDERNWK